MIIICDWFIYNFLIFFILKARAYLLQPSWIETSELLEARKIQRKFLQTILKNMSIS